MPCEACGAVLPVQAGRGRRRVVCSDACWQRVYRRGGRLAAVGVPTQPLLYHGRFQAYQAALAGKIDVILTDLPYPRPFLPLYQDLAQFALTTLVPGGWLLCLTGWPLVAPICTGWDALPGLQFVTVVKYQLSGDGRWARHHLSTGARRIREADKPILWY